jgi:hypothetical protein
MTGAYFSIVSLTGSAIFDSLVDFLPLFLGDVSFSSGDSIFTFYSLISSFTYYCTGCSITGTGSTLALKKFSTPCPFGFDSSFLSCFYYLFFVSFY